MKCSRHVPEPLKVWSHVQGRRLKLKFAIYPTMTRFRFACKKCRFLERERGRYRCAIDDPQFDLKFYGVSVEFGKLAWVGSVPPALKSRNPLLYAEAETFIRRRRARGFRRKESPGSDGAQRNETNLTWQLEKTAGLPGSGVSQDVPAASGQPLVV